MQSPTLQDVKPNRSIAIMLAKRELATFVYDAVQLEGITFTFPEVQTLLEGVTVGGHKLSDQKITLNQKDAWLQLFKWLQADDFKLSAVRACQLHGIAAEQEALAWGCFRHAQVTIAGTDYMPPQACELPALFEQMLEIAQGIEDVYDKAIHIFLTMARAQFFFDVNKRMGRFLMNGVLLDAGYPAINVPVVRKAEFNEKMLAFYASNEPMMMNAFLRSCVDSRVVRIMAELD